jgi:hypothetical protein
MALRTVLQGARKYQSLPHSVLFGEFDTPKNTTADGRQVWLYMGDSLAQGTNQGTDTGPPVYYANSIFYWNQGGGTIDPVTTNDVGNANAGSIWVKFGIDYYRKTGYRCVFVREGVGGSTVFPIGTTNNWFDYTQQYGQAVSDTQACLTNIGLQEIRGVILLCGINDARNSESLGMIKNAYYMWIEKINRTLKNPFIYFINIGRDENGTGRGQRVTAIDSYIEEVSAYFPNVRRILRLADYIDVPDIYSTSFSDVHLTQFGNDFVGAKCVRNMSQMGLIADKPRKYTYSSTVNAVFARFSNLSEEEKMVMSDFIEYMSAQGDLSFDAFYLPLFKDSANCMQDWFRDKKMSGGQVLPNRGGLRTYGTTASGIRSNFIPSTDGVNITQNNAMIGAFLLTNYQTTGADHYLFGVSDGTRVTQLLYSNTNVDKRWVMNGASNGTTGSGLFKKNSFYAVWRRASGSDNLADNYSTTPHTLTSNGLPTVEVTFAMRNVSGTMSAPYAGLFGCLFLGGAGTSSVNGSIYKKIRELVVDFLVMRD